MRAECALQIANASADGITVIDEWTSVVDRTVAKVMSHCISKHARKRERSIVLLTCHYDVLEWLDPDWIIDCNKQEFVDRRLLRRRSRTEQLQFDIRDAHRNTWRFFSRYHYLSDRLPGGHIETFGLYHRQDQIGFQCFANYVPTRDKKIEQMHMNRLVIHPDYTGLGIGILFINECSAIMTKRGYDVRARFSSVPVFKAMSRHKCWLFDGEQRAHKTVVGPTITRETGFRLDVTAYAFRFSLPVFNAMKAKQQAERDAVAA